MGGGLGGPALTASGRAVQLVGRYADDAVRVGYGGVASAVGYVAQPFARPVGVKILATGPVEAFYEKIMSSGSSSERNGTHVGPGGTSSREMKPMLSDASIRWQLKNGYSMRATTEHACGVGYRLVKRKGRYVCVKK